MVSSKDVLRGLLDHQGPEPSVLLNAGDDGTDVAFSRIVWMGLQVGNGGILNNR
jgi:hypothetical protein